MVLGLRIYCIIRLLKLLIIKVEIMIRIVLVIIVSKFKGVISKIVRVIVLLIKVVARLWSNVFLVVIMIFIGFLGC